MNANNKHRMIQFNVPGDQHPRGFCLQGHWRHGGEPQWGQLHLAPNLDGHLSSTRRIPSLFAAHQLVAAGPVIDRVVQRRGEHTWNKHRSCACDRGVQLWLFFRSPRTAPSYSTSSMSGRCSIHRNFWCNICETKSRKVMDVLPWCWGS